ncbi:pentatricopeptide repeat-containing protein 1, mitochondrial [Danaus plexippus]|uniref:pentatricopeptide repeat-containing protein 1, mitochondrial n=1 Tax=Danaus plexippus TaxID=13037 RepID=UPI002AAFC494|nr:pentatricopeptide repeat-containing protein 1, mitochondrial [Danaus plexippus]
MAFRCLNLLRNLKNNSSTLLRQSLLSTTTITNITQQKIQNIKEHKTENNITYLEDPDTFGTLSGQKVIKESLEDEGDIQEEKYLQEQPLKSQKLTIKQYADIIKQYLQHKRIKEAIDVLETRMLKEDRVKPENYIYNILIGACAEVGYTKKAFQLYNDMKRRALRPTGDTYTCLFESCINSPYPTYGLKMATHLRNLMIEKNIEPNLTNYNVMIKAFGRCADLQTAFKIVDEMISKKIKIRSHTFNHLLQACITDKNHGLKYALIVWRKMLNMKEKPNLYSFNLMLRCVKDCNVGTKEDLLEVIGIIQASLPIRSVENLKELEGQQQRLLSGAPNDRKMTEDQSFVYSSSDSERNIITEANVKHVKPTDFSKSHSDGKCSSTTDPTDLAVVNQDQNTLEVIENYKKTTPLPKRYAPNLLSRVVQIDQVLAFQDVSTSQEKFAIIGGQEDFLNEMEVYSIKPDIKTFTQMLPLIENSTEAENKLIDTMKTLKIKRDIDFYNMLIKKRCLRKDYDSAFMVRNLIEEDNSSVRKHPFNKKHKLKIDVMTYGALALACTTREMADKLLNEMKEKQLKVNIEMLGALLKNAAINMQFGYVFYVMDIVKQEKLKVNTAFLRHLETFNDRCIRSIEKNEKEKRDSPVLKAAYNRFSDIYNNWIKDVNVEEALKPENPWKQFTEPHPATVQRENFQIVEPKRFYKKKRHYKPYTPRLK